jgi:hypothetical protein
VDAVARRVLNHIVAWLGENGHQARVVGYPDEDERQTRAPDGLLDVDGEHVAVEVTMVAYGTRNMREADRLIARLKSRLTDAARVLGLGGVLVDYTFGDLPTKGRRKAEEAILAETIEAGMARLAPTSRTRLDLQPSQRWVHELALDHWPGRETSIGWIGTVARTGGNLDEMTDELVAEVIAKKAEQAAGYDTVWVALVGGRASPDADDLAKALRPRLAGLPTNWTRVLLVTRWDVTEVMPAMTRP